MPTEVAVTLKGMIARFAEQAPVAILVRGLLANILSRDELDAVFPGPAVRQYEDELLFSSVVELLQLVVTKSHKSMRAACWANQDQPGVSSAAVYDKLNGVETHVSRALVRQTARRMRQLIGALRGPTREYPGWYRLHIFDGSHFAATRHRLTSAVAIAALALADIVALCRSLEIDRGCFGPAPPRAIIARSIARTVALDAAVVVAFLCEYVRSGAPAAGERGQLSADGAP